MAGCGPMRRWSIAVAAITAGGFALRVWAATRESIFLDEVSLNWLVARPFDAMRGEVTAVENTPILGFALTWLSTRIGSAPEWVRLPSLLAGTLTIPATAALARECVGVRAALWAAGLVAASPFLNFFSVEARPYSLVCLFATLAALALTRACREGSSRAWWAAWTIATTLAMLSHYTAIFAIFAAIAWVLVFRPRSRLPLAIASIVAAGLFALVWWGPFTDQVSHSDQQVQFMKFLAPVTVGQLWRITATAFAGRPIVPLVDVPGVAVGIAVAALVVIGLASAGRIALSRGDSRSRAALDALGSNAGLLLAGAVVPPLCLVAASIASGGSFMLARNAIAAVPCALALVAAGFTQLGRRTGTALASVLAALLLAVTVVGTVDWPRPLMREVASAVAGGWTPGDVVLEQTYSQAVLNDADLAPYLPGAIAKSIVTVRIPRREQALEISRGVFNAAARRKGVVFVLTPTGAGATPAAPPAGSRLVRLWTKSFGGAGPLLLAKWVPTR